MESSEQAIQAHHYRDQTVAMNQPEKPLELHRAFGDLEDEVSSMRDSVQEMERRLSSYIRNEPTAPPVDGIADTNYMSDIAQRVERTKESVRSTRVVMNRLLDRLEI